MNFEDAIKELEEINKKLSSSSLTIEEAKALFERGKTLSKFCYENLKEVKGKIIEIKEEMGALIENEE